LNCTGFPRVLACLEFLSTNYNLTAESYLFFRHIRPVRMRFETAKIRITAELLTPLSYPHGHSYPSCAKKAHDGNNSKRSHICQHFFQLFMRFKHRKKQNSAKQTSRFFQTVATNAVISTTLKFFPQNSIQTPTKFCG